MKKNLSRSYIYLLLFTAVAAIASLTLVRIISGFEGQFQDTTGDLVNFFDER